MIVDFRQLDNDTPIETDLCIVGAGAAGITLAREFIGTKISVCLVESGGFEYDSEVQALYEGNNIGRSYYDLSAARLRYFGGTTNHWNGECLPLSYIDFEPRSWVPFSGWPFPAAHLTSYYERAQPICELAAFKYLASLWPELEGEFHDFDPRQFTLWVVQNSPPTRFGDRYRDELDRARNITVLLNANATNTQTNEAAATVQNLDLQTLEGRTGKITARMFVLACGAIENARLLLLSDRVEAGGLGNRNDMVGRFFMEHPHTYPMVLLTEEGENLLRTYQTRQISDASLTPCIFASAALQRREEILGGHAFLGPVADFDSGVRGAREIWLALRAGTMPNDLGDSVWRVMRDLDSVASYAYRLFTGRPTGSALQATGFRLKTEQAPNPSSRITLSSERDALALRRAQLDWRLSAIDKRTVKVLATTLGAECARLGLGRVRVADWLLDDGGDWPQVVEGGYHQMGTTRMAEDPRQGVVDGACRVHQTDNLYMAGSSVFPTSGSANPTLTIVALALRLADHLRARLTSRSD